MIQGGSEHMTKRKIGSWGEGRYLKNMFSVIVGEQESFQGNSWGRDKFNFVI